MHDAIVHAAAYVDAHGDDAERLCADALTGRADGTCALDACSVGDDACAAGRALAIADDLRALGDARVRGWCERLARARAADGGWAPGASLDERLFATGMLGGHLAKTRWVRPDVLGGAADFLARHWSPDRVRGGSWRAIAAHAHLFANADHDDADAILQWCGRELARAFKTGHFDAVRSARVLVWCDAHGLPGAPFEPGELLDALFAEQQPDGGFAEWKGEGERSRVGSTLDALVAMLRLGAGGSA